ncbi:hypothetical protein N9E29_03445 [Porticoccaceae bacterium]|nr:hypothetical protein [Porticoccaceae bacterium]
MSTNKLVQSHPLSEAIYEGVLETPPWTSLLKLLEQYVSTKSASLVIRRPTEEGPGSTITLFDNQDALQNFQTNSYRDSPFAELPEGKVFCLNDRVTQRELEDLDHYKYFLKVYDVTDIMGFDICDNNDDNHSRLRLRVVRMGDEPKFSREDRARLATIIPLMKNALAIYSRMEIGGVSQEIYQQLLSSMGIACFILGANYEVMAKNYLAEMVLSNKDGLSMAGKKLRCVDKDDQLALTTICQNIRQNIAQGKSQQQPDKFTINRPQAGSTWGVLIRPVDSGDFMGAENNPELLLLLRDSNRRQLPTPSLLIDIFGVTLAEARLTLKLLEGLSLTAAAEALGVSRNTARTQLSSVFSKTDLNSQTQLVKLVSDVLSDHWL